MRVEASRSIAMTYWTSKGMPDMEGNRPWRAPGTSTRRTIGGGKLSLTPADLATAILFYPRTLYELPRTWWHHLRQGHASRRLPRGRRNWLTGRQRQTIYSS